MFIRLHFTNSHFISNAHFSAKTCVFLPISTNKSVALEKREAQTHAICLDFQFLDLRDAVLKILVLDVALVVVDCALHVVEDRLHEEVAFEAQLRRFDLLEIIEAPLELRRHFVDVAAIRGLKLQCHVFAHDCRKVAFDRVE